MIVNKKELQTALTELARICEPKSSLEFCRSIRLWSSRSGSLELTTTNIDQHLQCQLACHGQEIDLAVETTPFKALVSGKCGKYDIVEVLPDPHDDSKALVICDDLVTRIPTTQTDLFPHGVLHWDKVGTYDDSLRSALEFVIPAVSDDGTRPHLNGVLFSADDKLVSTDGHRLHSVNTGIQLLDSIVVPRIAALALLRLLKTPMLEMWDPHICLDEDKRRVQFSVGAWLLDTRLIDNDFPPYNQVIPSKEVVLELETAVLTKCLKHMAKLKANTISLCVNGAVTMETVSSPLGDISADIPVLVNNHDGEDETLRIGFRPSYIAEAIADSTNQVAEITLGSALDPMRVDTGERIAVVMPKRV